jgi:hypothetical protein
MTVLVTAASRHDATQEIAERIGVDLPKSSPVASNDTSNRKIQA